MYVGWGSFEKQKRHDKTDLISSSAVRRSAGGRSTAGALALFGQTSRSRSLGRFFQLWLENQNDKKHDNFDKALFTNNGNIECIECAYDLLSQTISLINYHKLP